LSKPDEGENAAARQAKPMPSGEFFGQECYEVIIGDAVGLGE
jgi:hypothetical protein